MSISENTDGCRAHLAHTVRAKVSMKHKAQNVFFFFFFFYLVNCSKSSWSEHFDFLEFGLLQDAQQRLIWCLSAWGQRFNQLKGRKKNQYFFHFANDPVDMTLNDQIKYKTEKKWADRPTQYFGVVLWARWLKGALHNTH